MRTREKLLILLILATVILGAFVFLHFRDNELEANYFRWLLADTLRQGVASPVRNFFEGLPPNAVLFGSVGIFAAVIFVIGFKLLRDRELESLRRRLLMIGAAKTETESLLQEEVWKGRHERQARDSAMRDLESSIDKIEKLIVELDDKERQLNVRDSELMKLRSGDGSFAASESFPAPADRPLRRELAEANRMLQQKDSSIQELQSAFDAKSKIWESQLREKNALLKSRDEELEVLKAELGSLSHRFGDLEAAKKRSEDLLREELTQKNEVLEANELSIRNEQKRLSEKIRTFEAQLSEKDRHARGLDSELRAIQKRLGETTAAKERAERLYQQESLKIQEALRAKESVIEEMDQKRNVAARALHDELAQKDLLLQVRDDELKGLKAELKAVTLRWNEMAAAKEQTEKALAEETQKAQRLREAHDVANRALQERLGKEIKELEGQLGERRESLMNREREVTELKTQITSVGEQLTKIKAASERTVASLQQQLRKETENRQSADSAHRLLEESLKSKIETLEKQLAERQESVGGRDTEVVSLRSEIAALNQRAAEMAAAKEEADRLLREAINQNDELVRSNDARAATLKTLEEDQIAKLRDLESELVDKNSLLQARESELRDSKRQLAELNSSTEQALNRLQDDVRRKSDLLEEKEISFRSLEERLTGKVRSLETELTEHQESLRNRDRELRTVTSKANQLSAQLAALGSSKDQEAHSLRDELKQGKELLQARDAALKAAADQFAAERRSLEMQLHEKQRIMETRDAEIDALMAKVAELTQNLAELGAQQERADRLFQEQLREKAALVKTRESAADETGKRMVSKLQSLERQLDEKHRLLENSGAELAELRKQNQLVTQRLSETEAAMERAQSALQEERLRANGISKALVPVTPEAVGESDGDAGAVETLLNERNVLLKSRDKLIQDLMSELKEKKSQLAKFEIEVWQDIEKRAAWKQRLSKIGIRLKN
jgi:chromosome segregation ATPase